MCNHGWFRDDLVVNHHVPSDLYPDVLEWAGETFWTGPTDMGFFSDASDPNVAYIIWIDASPAAGVQSHFTMVWATQGTDDLVIDDSWDGRRKNLSSYGKPSAIIQAAYKFRKKEVQGDTDMAAPTPEEVTEAYMNITDRAPDQGEIDFHITKSSYKSMVKGFFANKDTAVARYEQAQTTVNNLQTQIDDLNSQLSARPTLESLANLQTALDEANKNLEQAKKDLEAAKSKPAILDKTTPSGKGLRTFFQGLVGLYSLAVPIFSLPEVQALVTVKPGIAVIPAVGAALTAIITYVQNKLEAK
jgi:hypothetical protein